MPPNSLVRTWLSGPFEILFPRECLVCTRPLRGTSLCFRCTPATLSLSARRCARCFGVLPTSTDDTCAACHLFPLAADRVRHLWEYEGVARDYIRAMKYHPSPYLAGIAGTFLTRHMAHLFGEDSWDLIVPVPSSPAMLKKRLFHPCLEMSKPIREGRRGTRIVHGLQHRGNRTPQARRSHQDRLKGLRGIFTVRNPALMRGKRVLLVEDVITTGATLEAASYALRAVGVRSLDVIALAEARVWRRFRSQVFGIFEPFRAPISGVLALRSVIPLSHGNSELQDESSRSTDSFSRSDRKAPKSGRRLSMGP